MSVRARTEEIEQAVLAPWATTAVSSRGRTHDEEPDGLRTVFQVDRDRVLHTKAFRRLKHKTQVFLAPMGDHYRTRLTHTLEVAQVARTICRALRLNEDLVEAICLAHDVGHTPFGHVGERALGEVMGRPFEHNRQSLRVVDHLERLNLTWEVRDGVVNHTWTMPEPATPEGVVARWADRIAYINHDVDDAMRAGVLEPGDLPPDAVAVLGKTSGARVDAMVRGIVEPSLEAGDVAVRADVSEAMAAMRAFLFERVYLGPARVEAEKAEACLHALFLHHLAHPDGISGGEAAPGDLLDRVADYVSGMTDRFAIREYRRLFVPTTDVRDS